MNLNPVLTIHTDTVLPPSLLSSVSPPRKAPVKRNNELSKNLFQEDVVRTVSDFSNENCPIDFSFNKLDDSVIFYRLVFSENGVPQVKESIRICSDLRVSLTYEGIHIPLPEWLKTSKITRYNMIENLSTYIWNRVNELPMY